ncbi:MAG: Flp pilus assembly protein CpaB [Rhodobiaceae bacterium]|nr:MAG: Flp pilus assembly protein CpaB [Rhodobiaceae bacterium]
MNAMRIGILALALVAAGLAAFLARSLVGDEQQVQVATPQVVEQQLAEVLVAATNIAIGQRVGKSDIVWQSWPDAAIVSSYVTRDVQPNALEVFAGAIARSPLLAGEPVLAGKLVSFENAGFMSALLSPGMRAVAMKISPETSAGGFILPNDRVDVIVTMRVRGGGAVESGDGRDGYRSQTLLTNVRVLAIDQTVQELEGEQVVVGKTATLEVLPEQAEDFALAEAQGTVSLSLRALADMKGAGQVPRSGAAQDEGTRSRQGTTVRILRYGTETTVSTIAGRGR